MILRIGFSFLARPADRLYPYAYTGLLTSRQQEILEFVRSFQRTNEVAPVGRGDSGTFFSPLPGIGDGIGVVRPNPRRRSNLANDDSSVPVRGRTWYRLPPVRSARPRMVRSRIYLARNGVIGWQ
jgi:hypothetical protein